MNSYNINTIVSSQEADSLKELIFNRARERAKSLENDIKSSYVDTVQYDVMDLARASFVSNKNPFKAELTGEVNRTTATEKDEVEKKLEIKSSEKQPESGFTNNVSEIKTEIYEKNRTINKDMTNREVNANMDFAREELANKKSFIGALDFLNSQASIALIKKGSGKHFDALA